MKLLTSQKEILGPVHLHPKTDKWDYLRSPIMKKNFISCFDIGEVPRSHGKWNWNWLYFLPLIFTFEQGALSGYCSFNTYIKAGRLHMQCTSAQGGPHTRGPGPSAQGTVLRFKVKVAVFQIFKCFKN